MSFRARLVHSITIKRIAPTATLDGHGQPVPGEVTVASGIPGLVQPRGAREVAQANQAGAAIGDYMGFMVPVDGITTREWIELSAPASMAGRYDIVSVADAAGIGHHLELGLRRVS